MRRSLFARAYRRLVPGRIKARVAPIILKHRHRRETIRKAERVPGAAWREQRLALGGDIAGFRPFRYFPGGYQNPYLRLLYGGLPEAGFDVAPLGHYEAIDEEPASSVFHLHWTRVFQVGTASEAEARSQTRVYLGRIERFLERGGSLLWSVHEWLPHDCEFPDVEVELRSRLAELASAVHVLHASTVDEVAGLYPLDPAKVLVVEHPLYSGVYPDYVTRSAARRMLGVADDEVLLLGFGAIRPYKGFDRLVRLLPRLREQTGLRVRVMLAGPTFKSIDIGPLRDLVASVDGASMTDRAVPDEYVQVLFRAADVAVLPYRQVVNSGVLMLALTFGCPAVVSENPVTRDAVGSGLVHVFDRGSDEGLLAAVVAAIERRHRRGIESAEYGDRYDPRVIAREFADEVRRRIGELPPSPIDQTAETR
ncbi:MAG: glycosyltransferase [Actinobacteria bacterium]|nr:glycosyltransferase [Actinomycetota bacterium]